MRTRIVCRSKKIRGGWQASAGGLVAALRPALETRDSAWVGWDGGAEDMPRRVDGLDIELAPVGLSRREVADYYHGFSNRTLWPLLHGAIEPPVFERGWWQPMRPSTSDSPPPRLARARCGGCTTTS